MINEEYLELLKECGLSNNPKQQAKGIHFGFLMTFKDEFPALKEYVLDGEREVFPYDEFQIYQINLCRTNAEMKLELKVPLFSGVTTDEFSQFLDLLSTHYINNLGHCNNQLNFSIFSSNNDDKTALQKTKADLGNKYNVEKVAIIVSNYYETTKYPTKLCSFLGTNNIIMAYNNYVN